MNKLSEAALAEIRDGEAMRDARLEAKQRAFDAQTEEFALTDGRRLKLYHRMTGAQVRVEVFRFLDELSQRDEYKHDRGVLAAMTESEIFLLANVSCKLRDEYIGQQRAYFYWTSPKYPTTRGRKEVPAIAND